MSCSKELLEISTFTKINKRSVVWNLRNRRVANLQLRRTILHLPKPRKPSILMSGLVGHTFLPFARLLTCALILASYQIYALKPKSAAQIDEGSPEPLLRWWDAYPVARSSPSFLSSDELVALVNDSSEGEFAVIDVRRNDFTVGPILSK